MQEIVTQVANRQKVARLFATTSRITEIPWHCHMLEHEDNKMMLQFEMVP
jgi:FtsP/CotA-like multicopper oxidase with cupredoxin domain